LGILLGEAWDRTGQVVLIGIAAAGDAGVVEGRIAVGLQRQLEQGEGRVQRGQFQPGGGGLQRLGGVTQGVFAAQPRRQRRSAGGADQFITTGVVGQCGGVERDGRRRAILERGDLVLDLA